MKTTVGLDRLLTLIEAYEILTIAASGRVAEARARFVAAERRLILLDHPVLLRRCEEAFSGSPVA